MRFRNFKCEIELENDAMLQTSQAGRDALASMLTDIASRVKIGLGGELTLRDENGNRVGYAKIYRKEVK